MASNRHTCAVKPPTALHIPPVLLQVPQNWVDKAKGAIRALMKVPYAEVFNQPVTEEEVGACVCMYLVSML